MSFKTWLTEWRLDRTERQLKTLRSQMKDLRKKQEELDRDRGRAEIPEPQYRQRKERMEEHRQRLLRDIHALEEQEKNLRRTIYEAPVA